MSARRTAVTPVRLVQTTAMMRKAVTEWLREEHATSEQALQLLDALYGGAIRGTSYEGVRDFNTVALMFVEQAPDVVTEDERWSEGNRSCGCLVDTLERIRRERPTLYMDRDTATWVVFALAQKIGFGDTPATNRWARAAVQGIEDYLRSI